MVSEYPVCLPGTLNAKKDLSRILDVDVRTLVDVENPLFEYELNIIRVVSYLELGEKAVICCSAGVSRSNAIAL